MEQETILEEGTYNYKVMLLYAILLQFLQMLRETWLLRIKHTIQFLLNGCK